MKEEDYQLIHGLANKITSIYGKSRKVKKAVQSEEVSAEVDKLIELTEEAASLIRQLKVRALEELNSQDNVGA